MLCQEKVRNTTNFLIKGILIPAPLMSLSADVLDAIRNQTYRLRPVRITEKARRQSSPPEDFNIAQILARRVAMGYDTDNVSVKSVGSDHSDGSVESVKSSGSIKSVGSTKRLGSIRSIGSIKSIWSVKSAGSTKSIGSVGNSKSITGSMR